MGDIAIGIVGAGTVGGGAIKVLRDKLEFFRQTLGLPVRLARVADINSARFEELGLGKDVTCGTDAGEITGDPDIRIVVELVGGTTLAREVIVGALERGKHVVTANKALLAEHGPEIFGAASRNNVSVYFEGAVGGGMPIIKTLREATIANDIVSIKTVINGTCNYILTQMAAHGWSFEEALAHAQRNGYAESDPTLDIGGGDTGHKLAIMASLAYRGYVPFAEIPIEGITGVTAQDIAFARELGYTIKLLGIINGPDGGALDVRVHPAMLRTDHILSSVSDVFNAVWLRGDSVGSILLYGRGAGELPTASAVVSDIIDCARDITTNAPRRIAMDFYGEKQQLPLKPLAAVRSRYYLRFSVIDKPGVLAGITSSLGNHDISIASVIQKEGAAEDFVPVIVLTHEASEKNVVAALTEVDGKEFVRARTQLIRIEA